MSGVLVMSLLLFFGSTGGGGIGPGPGGVTSTGAYTQVWAYLDAAWAEITRDILVDSVNLSYGLTGNRPSDALAGTGTLDFSLNNSASNSGGVVGYYSPYHASKRTGWTAGAEIFLWLEGASVVSSVSSMTRSGTTVTVTTGAAHGLITGYTVRLSGAVQTDYNWFWVVTVTSATQFTFQIGTSPATPATGTITATRGKVRFWGRIDTIDPVPGPYGARQAHVVAYDRMRDLIDADLYDVSLQLNKTESQIFSSIFGSLDPSIAPRGQTLDEGIDQIPYALDDLGDGTKAASVIVDLTRSSYGLGFVYEYGLFRYLSRNTRATANSVAIISSTMSGFVAAGSISRSYNLIRTTTHPRSVDGIDVVLYAASGTPPYVPALSTITVEGAFRSPDDVTRLIGAASTVKSGGLLPQYVDYMANSQADGAGADVTSSITITPIVQASRVSFTIANGSATPAYLVNASGDTLLQIRGRGVYDNGPRTFQTTSAQSYGVRVSNLDLPYQNVDATGQQIADFTHDQYKTIGTQVDSVTLKASPSSNPLLYIYLSLLDVGDVVTLSETVTGVSSVDAMVLGVSMRWLTKQALECTWLLGPKITLTPPTMPTAVTITNLTDGDFSVGWATGTAGSYTQIYVDGIYYGTAGIGEVSFSVNNRTRATDYVVTARHMYFGMPSAFTAPVTARPVVAATGGTVTISGGYKYHSFTSSGNLVVTVPGRYDIWILGGGGGGGGWGDLIGTDGTDHGGGGGGAGAFVEMLDEQEPAGTYAIVVGATANGGAYGNLTVGGHGSPGNSSSYRDIVAAGGGRGAGGYTSAAGGNGTGNTGVTGGSSGGGGAGPLAGAGGSDGGGGAGDGGPGESNFGGSSGGGGGGGSTQDGGIANVAAGGAGRTLYGVAVTEGGLGGRGAGTPSAGAANTGSGGGGGESTSPSGNGYAGGSGWVLIRYPIGDLPMQYDVTDYGAVGDGVANDAPVFNAIASIISTTGGVVYVPSGKTCLLGSTVTFTNASGVDNAIDIRLELHPLATIVVPTGANGLVFDGTTKRIGRGHTKTSGVFGGRIWAGSPTTYTTGTVIKFIATDGATVEDVEVRGGTIGVHFQNCYAALVADCFFVHNHSTIYLNGTTIDLKVERNGIYDCDTDAIISDGTGNARAVIANNYIEGLTGNVINQAGTSDHYWQILDNFINDCSGSVEVLIITSGALIAGNVFTGHTGTGVGISLTSTAAFCSVIGNRCFGGTTYSPGWISLASDTHAVTGNTHDGNGNALDESNPGSTVAGNFPSAF